MSPTTAKASRPAFLPRAFERFSRADEARAAPGNGLGLAIVEAIAQAHGGGAGAENRSGGGSDAGSRCRGAAEQRPARRRPREMGRRLVGVALVGEVVQPKLTLSCSGSALTKDSARTWLCFLPASVWPVTTQLVLRTALA